MVNISHPKTNAITPQECPKIFLSTKKMSYISKESSEDSRGPGEEKRKTNCLESQRLSSFARPKKSWELQTDSCPECPCCMYLAVAVLRVAER